ncbi:ribonuclease H-like domain-containing protein [Powellomyces hirtus]|nr:ribonuclease H-like domain-containing protein [Powellomyces hirtus]
MAEQPSKNDPLTAENFEAFQNDLFSALAQTTKAATYLSPTELGFYKASAEGFEENLSRTSENILALCNQLLTYTSAGSAGSDRTLTPFEDADDVTDRFPAVVDAVDNLLEKADVCLDQVTGRIKANASNNAVAQTAAVIMQVQTKHNSIRNVVHAQNIVRPQLSFEDKVDNSNAQFVRKITHKPNARQPLDYGLPGSEDISPEMGAHLRTLGITDASSSPFSLPHPYEFEIQNLDYPSHMFEARPEQLYASLEATPFTWVDTDEKLEQLAALLDTAKEIAVDLEHHDYRSFQGFVCLAQISTRTEDFIIDTLAVRSKMHILNSSFTNPDIVKVFHGAESDIQWLQRDFGLYVVNLFDTYHASHLLELPHHGLQYLLKFYCNVETNKAYQLADWRIRPLPTELMKYARSDTHFLLYIYDRMRNELLNLSNPETHNLLRATLQRSATTSLNKYEKDIYDSETGEGPGGWRNPLRKYGGALGPDQFAVFRAIHAWRDHIAREEDESPRYVLPNHMMFTLADRMPTNQQGILGCCTPVPPLVRMYATDLAIIIENALTEAKRSSSRNEAMLKKLAEDEAEWKKKKALGPQHKRFDDKDAMDVDESERSTARGSPLSTVEPLPDSRIFGKSALFEATIAGSRIGTVGRVTISTHSIFGSRDDNDEDEEDVRARQMAEQIRKTLYLVAPSTLLLKRKRDEELADKTPEAKRPQQTEVVIPVSVERPSIDTSSVAEEMMDLGGSQSPDAPDADTPMLTETITIDDEEVEVANLKRGKAYRRKLSKARKKAEAAVAAAGLAAVAGSSAAATPIASPASTPGSTPASTPASKNSNKSGKGKGKGKGKGNDKGKGPAPVIEPFDYSTAKSVINNGNTPKSAKKQQQQQPQKQKQQQKQQQKQEEVIDLVSDADSTTAQAGRGQRQTPGGSNKKRKQNAQQTQHQQQTVFNPYGASADPKQKKDPRTNLRPKSGNKSGTFPRNS